MTQRTHERKQHEPKIPRIKTPKLTHNLEIRINTRIPRGPFHPMSFDRGSKQGLFERINLSSHEVFDKIFERTHEGKY